MEFAKPIAFEAHNLAKLSGIVNGKTGSLLACMLDGGAYLWGMCYFKRGAAVIGEVPASTEETRHFSPDCPTITISGTGALQITRGNSVIGRIEGGRFMRSQATVFTSFMLGQYLYPLVGVEADAVTRQFKSDAEADRAKSFLVCLEYIVEVLSQRNAGATIILVPPTFIDRALDEADTAWGVVGSLEINLLQSARLNFDRLIHQHRHISNALFRLDVDQSLRYRLRSLVDLSRVDGALLLTPTFDVIGFGMKLKSQKWIGGVQHGPLIQDVESEHLDFSKLGTRHNSALNFVGSLPGSVAFVASSDGPIRALVRSSVDKICYWPDCRVSMFA
jgi:hypothetical protein